MYLFTGCNCDKIPQAYLHKICAWCHKICSRCHKICWALRHAYSSSNALTTGCFEVLSWQHTCCLQLLWQCPVSVQAAAQWPLMREWHWLFQGQWGNTGISVALQLSDETQLLWRFLHSWPLYKVHNNCHHAWIFTWHACSQLLLWSDCSSSVALRRRWYSYASLHGLSNSMMG